jgi:ABC-type multidrug transport system permease subunit
MLPFAASRIAIQAPVRMLQALLFSTIVYWLAGLWQSAGHFFFAMLVLAVQSGTFVVFAHAAAASVADPMNASLAATTIVVVLVLFGGFLITRTRIPKPYIWVYYLSPMKYAGDALLINEFHNRSLRCTPEELMPPASHVNLSLPYPDGFSGVQVCKYINGDQLLESRGIDAESWRMWFDFAIVVVFFLAFCVVYYLAERFIRWPASTRSIGAPAPVSPVASLVRIAILTLLFFFFVAQIIGQFVPFVTSCLPPPGRPKRPRRGTIRSRRPCLGTSLSTVFLRQAPMGARCS